jgi:hypothetical protein
MTMLTTDNADPTICGQILRLDNGSLAIALIRSGVERLVLCGHTLSIIDSRRILELARCLRCQGERWWIQRDIPLCLTCAPPSADELNDILTRAHGWAQGAGVSELSHVVDRMLVRGSFKHWEHIQQAAFFQRGMQLVAEWFEKNA